MKVGLLRVIVVVSSASETVGLDLRLRSDGIVMAISLSIVMGRGAGPGGDSDLAGALGGIGGRFRPAISACARRLPSAEGLKGSLRS